MSIYLDASVLVSLFTSDSFSVRADKTFRNLKVATVVSDFAAAEFASVTSRMVRTGELTRDEALGVFADFDNWTLRMSARAETTSADIRTAEAALRRIDMPLRAPDALNIAIARRVGADLATFDQRMADCARSLGISVVPI